MSLETRFSSAVQPFVQFKTLDNPSAYISAKDNQQRFRHSHEVHHSWSRTSFEVTYKVYERCVACNAPRGSVMDMKKTPEDYIDSPTLCAPCKQNVMTIYDQYRAETANVEELTAIVNCFDRSFFETPPPVGPYYNRLVPPIIP